MSDLLQPGQHPDADQLSVFVEQALPPHEREQILAHLAICPDCRSIVFLTLPPLEDAVELLPQPIASRRPWFAGWGVMWPAAAAVAATVLIFLSFHHTGATKSPTVPPAIADVKPAALPANPLAQKSAPSAKNPLPKLPANPAALQPHAVGVAAPPRQAAGDSSTVLDAKNISNLPLNGRNMTDLSTISGQPNQQISRPPVQYQPQGAIAGGARDATAEDVLTSDTQRQTLTATAPTTSGAIAGTMTPRPAPTPSAPPPPSIATESSIADFAAATPQPASNAASTPIVTAAASSSNFPGRLPIAATGTVANHILALDASGALFVSDNGGRQWRPVPSPWQGRVARLQVTAFPLASAGGGRAPTGSGAAVGGGGASAAAAKARIASSDDGVIADSGIAPSSAASVFGVIADPTGAVIPSATVTATDTRTKQAYNTTSDTSGRFSLSGLVADTYQLTVQSPGFVSQQQSLLLATGAHAQVNAMLYPSAASTEVTVSAAAAPLLQTEDDVLGEVVTTAKTSAAQPVVRRQAPAPVFEITTETGDRWTSADGQRWEKR